LPLGEAVPGMVLGAPLNTVERGVLGVSLPAGHALTEENLHQLRARHAEFIFVLDPDLRSDEQVGADAAAAARRVMQIFEGVNLKDRNMLTLFDQVLIYRSA
jgi:hypothetical protein